MQKITPHLWFDTQAVEAATFYASALPRSNVLDVTTLYDTPSGDCDVVSFELFGQPFMAISAGPRFTFNPSVSFLIRCDDPQEVDAYWNRLSDGGKALMPLATYPFSKRYGWTEDRYGVSWQVMLDDEPVAEQCIIPALMFVGDVCGKAEEAIEHYISVLGDGARGDAMRYGVGEEPDREGTIKHERFLLRGQQFAAMDSAHAHRFQFNEAISFMVPCDTQEEIDHVWERLSAVPEAEQCGWLKDGYGVSWQVVPAALNDMLRKGTKEQIARVTQAFLQMKKFDLAELQRAFDAS